MKRQVVSFEISEKLHKLGYNGQEFFYYNIYNKKLFVGQNEIHSEAIAAPTFTEAANWLNKKYGTDIGVTAHEIEDFLKKLI